MGKDRERGSSPSFETTSLQEANIQGEEEVLAQIKGILSREGTTLEEIIQAIPPEILRSLPVVREMIREDKERDDWTISAQTERISFLNRKNAELRAELTEITQRMEQTYDNVASLVRTTIKFMEESPFGGLVRGVFSRKGKTAGLRAAISVLCQREPEIASRIPQVEERLEEVRLSSVEEAWEKALNSIKHPRAKKYLKNFAYGVAVTAAVGGLAWGAKQLVRPSTTRVPLPKPTISDWLPRERIFARGPTSTPQIIFETPAPLPTVEPQVSKPAEPDETKPDNFFRVYYPENQNSNKGKETEKKAAYDDFLAQRVFTVEEGKTFFRSVPILKEGWREGDTTLGDVMRMVIVDGFRALGRNPDCPQPGEQYNIDDLPENFKKALNRFAKTKGYGIEFLKISGDYQESLKNSS